MYRLALTMLVNERGKYLGIIAALSFTAFMMAQQPAIFFGILSRTTAVITELPIIDLWVMDANVESVDDPKPLPDTQLYLVKGVSGVAWAVPFYRGSIKARLPDGNFLACQLIGVDDASLIGGPAKMAVGSLADLKISDGVLLDEASARGRLAQTAAGGQGAPFGVGSTLELNDTRAMVVGLHQASPSFQSQPIIYTTYSRSKAFLPSERKLLSFVLVKLKNPGDAARVIAEIHARTGLAAYTSTEFRELSTRYFLFRTGVFANFAISAVIAFLIGGGIAGQTFYNFTLDHLRYFGVLKAMGASDGLLLGMIALQSVTAGLIGFGLGVGAVTFFGTFIQDARFAFEINNWIVIASGAAIVIVSLLSALLSARPVLRLEPSEVFRG